MSKYCNNFDLNPNDIDIIETALRKVMSLHTESIVFEDCSKTSSTIRSMNEVLAKLHHQKVFYSQVNKTGIPSG